LLRSGNKWNKWGKVLELQESGDDTEGEWKRRGMLGKWEGGRALIR